MNRINHLSLEIPMNNLKIRSMKLVKLAAAAALLVAAGQASAAAQIGQEPPSNLIVQAGGLEWVYASPCAGESPSCSSVQLHHGFGFATDAQWNASFSTINDLLAAFNPTSGALCASSYFDVNYNHCDIGDVQTGHIWHSPLAPDATHRDNAAAETFLVRAGNVNDVPEPASLALAGVALLGAAVARRRKQAR